MNHHVRDCSGCGKDTDQLVLVIGTEVACCTRCRRAMVAALHAGEVSYALGNVTRDGAVRIWSRVDVGPARPMTKTKQEGT